MTRVLPSRRDIVISRLSAHDGSQDQAALILLAAYLIPWPFTGSNLDTICQARCTALGHQEITRIGFRPEVFYTRLPQSEFRWQSLRPYTVEFDDMMQTRSPCDIKQTVLNASCQEFLLGAKYISCCSSPLDLSFTS